MKLNKCKTVLFIVTISLAGYGANQLYKNVNVTYNEQHPVIQQQALNQPAVMPNFELSKTIDEREALFAKLSGSK